MRKQILNRKGMMVILAMIPFILFSQKQKEGITLNLHHYVGEKQLVLDDSTYFNSLNQSFTISKFNYYIGQIHLIKTNGEEVILKEYHFVSEDEEKTESKKIILNNIPSGEYCAMSFIIGVDSLDNCSGSQTGALDPINAMFWTWNTGYVFMKLEGKSAFSSATGNHLEYHIGGYKQPTNSIRAINLSFLSPIVIVKKAPAVNVHLKVDVLEILKTPNPIDFNIKPTVNTVADASIIANNYCDMFHFMKEANEK